ncbi:MAG: DNA mismatch repair endonuclease MutL [Clostridia bacterium]|nr:DNA mismatch repair endonuclease MutL [Clostridia bacterium]
MGIINVLDAQTANMIAAGEVVERPSSAAKELLENSIDAGAKNITLELRNGGRTLLRVTDDGSGFLREDIPKALLRHATSKIECGDDIYGVRSLGFRGEALAAIGSVSRLEIVTKHRDEDIGTRLTSDENGIIMEDFGCPDGTTVTMRDIFYNTPARQKFMKKDGTEGASCVAAAERLALSHPEISFTVISDGERKFQTAGDGELFPAVYSVFGRDFAKKLVPIEYELMGVNVKGYVTSPDAARKSRAMQTMFVNGRYVKSRTVQAALEEAFRSFIPRGGFPGCIIFVSLMPELTDVNVHPAKTEIKFVSERDVFHAVYYAVKNALEAEPEEKLLGEPSAKTAPAAFKPAAETAKSTPAATLASPVSEHKPTATPIYSNEVKTEKKTLPPLTREEDPFSESAAKNTVERKPTFEDVRFFDDVKPTPPEKKAFRADIGEDDLFDSTSKYTLNDSKQMTEAAYEEAKAVTEATQESEEGAQASIVPETPTWRMIGQAYDSYIFVETEDNVLIVDKHAAHERVLYEKLAANKELHVQELLAGVPVTLGREQTAILLENAEFLEEKGFRIEDFGEGTLIVRTVPTTLARLNGLEGILEDFAKTLADGNGLSFAERCDRALYTVACKAALKARIKNRPEDDENVIKMLAENPHLRFCPHGRPFIKTLPKREIEKYFDR